MSLFLLFHEKAVLELKREAMFWNAAHPLKRSRGKNFWSDEKVLHHDIFPGLDCIKHFFVCVCVHQIFYWVKVTESIAEYFIFVKITEHKMKCFISINVTESKRRYFTNRCFV